MIKAQQRALDSMIKGKDEFKEMLAELEKEFSKGGLFIPHRHTSSYAEIPAHRNHDKSPTYILRQYKGIELVTFGNTIFFARNEKLEGMLKKPARFRNLAGTEFYCIKAEDCYYYLTDEGRELQQEILKNWETLTQPLFAVNINTGGSW